MIERAKRMYCCSWVTVKSGSAPVGASEPCCQAVETTFTSEKFYGCLCHPVLLNTVISQANAFLPGASALIPDTLNNCTSEYGSPLAFYGQNNGSHTCDPSVIVDVDATLEVSAIDSAASALPLPTAMSRAEDDDPRPPDPLRAK